MAIVSSAGGLTPSSLETIIWLVVAIAILFAIFRFAIRYTLRKLLYDDLAVAVAWLLLLSLAIMYKHAIPIMFELDKVAKGEEMLTQSFLRVRAPTFLKLQFAIIVLFWTTIWTVKISFLIFYWSLFTGLEDHRRGWWVVAGFTALGYFLCWAFQLGSCVPIAHYFILGACETPRDIHYSNACLYVASTLDIVSDLMIMALGLRLLRKLCVSSREKLALAAIFSVGLIKITFAVIRVVKIGASATHVNPIWLALWSMIEASVAIVVACLPSFKVLFAYGRRQSDIRPPETPRRMSKRHSQGHSNGMSQPLETGEHSNSTQNRPVTGENPNWHSSQTEEELVTSDP